VSAPDVVLPAYYIRQIVDQVAQSGVAVDGWLAHVGLAPARLETPLVALSFAEFRQLVLDALALTREPALALLIGSRLQANTHGILGYAAMSGGSIREVVGLLEKFIGLRANLLVVSHEETGDEMRVHFAEALPLGDIQRPVFEAVVMAIKNMLDFITMGSCQVRVVAIAAPSAGNEAIAATLFGCPVQYGATWTGFALPLSVVDQPLRMADPAAFQEAARLCAHELEQRHGLESLAARVRQLMLQTQGDFPSLQVTARFLHLTPRTLHRRLEAEGTSFRSIQEEVRHMLALEYLKAGRLSLQEIAYALGYTEMANFRRAFRRWTGVAPSHYRDGDDTGP
jgi:AraC-like DNA-binding protein